MKKLINALVLTTLLLSGAISFSSCEKEDEAKLPLATITLKAKEAKSTSISFNISTTDATEMAYQVIKGVVETLPAAEAIFTEENKLPAEQSTDIEISDLDANALYTIVAVAKNGDNIFTEVTKLEMTTSELCTLSIDITECLPTIIRANVSSSNPEVKFITLAYKAADIKALDDDKAHEFIMNDLKAKNEGKDIKTILSGLYRTDFVKANFTNLDVETEYVIVAYVVDETGKRLTAITRKDAKTLPVQKSQIDWNIKYSFTHNYGEVMVFPTIMEERYVYVFNTIAEGPAGAKTAQDFANAYVKENKEKLDRGQAMVQGKVIQKYELKPMTEYYILVFAYNFGITSEIKLIRFTTPDIPRGPEDMRYQIEFKGFTEKAGHFIAHVKPNSDSLYYGIVGVSDLSEENILFEKEQFVKRFRDYANGGMKPLSALCKKGESDIDGIFRTAYGADFHIIAFCVYQGEDNKYHYSEYTEVKKNAWKSEEYFTTKVSEPRVEGGEFKVDVEVKQAKTSNTYYRVEAIPSSECNDAKIQERKDAWSAFLKDSKNWEEGDQTAYDMVMRYCHKGEKTVTIGKNEGVTAPSTKYTLIIYQIGNRGDYSSWYHTTIVKDAFTTPAK